MAIVRVPKEKRPPSRFGEFKDGVPSSLREYQGLFRCSGKYRVPKEGEFYWYKSMVLYACGSWGQPAVILEKVK